jgi:signal transduction histidine kinase
LQAKYEIEKKEKEKEIYRLKNIELAEANEAIQHKNEELNLHKEHLRLINKILRHDLVNHLASIQSSIRLFRSDRDWELLLHVEDSIKNSVQLIDRMRELEIILVANKQLKPFDVKEVLTEILQQYQAKIEWNMEGEGKILADEAVASVFDNIISNAILHGGANKLTISIAPHKKYYEVRIADDGIGIPNEIKEKVFDESFSYGKKGNTGLGLFIVKKTIESYQGVVYIEDNQPNGTVFVLLFRRIK